MKVELQRRRVDAVLTCAIAVPIGHAQTAPAMKMSTPIPAELMTPDKVETRLGSLQSTDGFPDKATVDKLYDNLDFMRGTQAFLNTVPGASMVAIRNGLREFGPDQGKGGKFLILPPGYKGEVPKGCIVARSPTLNNLLFWRGFLVDGDPKPAADSIKRHFRVYPLGKQASAPKMNFVNGSGKPANTVHANSFKFYEEIDQLVQDEPSSAIDMETLGLLASIGIVKGQPFAPDAPMKKILTDAVAVGNATARACSAHARSSATAPPSTPRRWPSSGWASARNTPVRSRTPKGSRSTAARTTSCACRRTFRPRTSGSSCATKTRRARCCRPTPSFQASAARRTGSW